MANVRFEADDHKASQYLRFSALAYKVQGIPK